MPKLTQHPNNYIRLLRSKLGLTAEQAEMFLYGWLENGWNGTPQEFVEMAKKVYLSIPKKE